MNRVENSFLSGKFNGKLQMQNTGVKYEMKNKNAM
jgi:hypothetical protein